MVRTIGNPGPLDLSLFILKHAPTSKKRLTPWSLTFNIIRAALARLA
jgi:hypothetical protein